MVVKAISHSQLRRTRPLDTIVTVPFNSEDFEEYERKLKESDWEITLDFGNARLTDLKDAFEYEVERMKVAL